MISTFLAFIGGVGAGIFTGLLPGIHTNLVAVLLLSISGMLLRYVDPPTLGVFMISMSIVNAFLSIIPSIFLGAPDAENVLGVLPGHRMLLQGRGYEAVALSTVGSFWSLMLVVFSAPLAVVALVSLQEILSPWIGWILLGIVLWMIMREKGRLEALFVFLLSGVLGLAVLSLGVNEPLFPLLSGLFGLSTLITSLQDTVRVPVQRISSIIHLDRSDFSWTVCVASFVGTLVGFFPGVGPAQAAVMGSLLLRGGHKNFLVLVGGISSANMVASLITFYAIDRARNGSIVAVQHLLQTLTRDQFVLYLVTACTAASVAFILTLFFARYFARWIARVNYRLLCTTIIVLIVVLVIVVSGWMGLLVLVVATFVGMTPLLLETSRSQAMGCLLLPVILWFLL